MGLVSRAELPAAGGGTGEVKTGGLKAPVSCGGTTVVVVVVTPVVVVVVTFGHSLGGLDDSCCPEPATLLMVSQIFHNFLYQARDVLPSDNQFVVVLYYCLTHGMCKCLIRGVRLTLQLSFYRPTAAVSRSASP